ncbi:MAG: hypothetical protein ACI8SE_001902 [Bacteroidia bacterium]|jgi:hypothetical protein
MKNWLAVVFYILLSQLSYGQEIAIPIKSGSIEIPPTQVYQIPNVFPDVNSVTDYLTQHHSVINQPGYSVELIQNTNSLTGNHYTYKVYKNEYHIYGVQIRLHTDKNGTVRYVHDNVPDINVALTPNLLSSHKMLVLADGNWQVGTLDEVDNAFGSRDILVDGETKGRLETKLFYNVQDTQVKAHVFLVNPLNTAERTYGTPYIDSSDLDVPQLNAERKWVDMKVDFKNDTFWLKSDRYFFGHVSNPVTKPTFAVSDTFSFTRSQYQFEDVNAFYHITNMSQYVEKLGFSNALPDSLLIDAHAYNGSDFSSFNYGVTPVELEFGEGGVDDGEDGEIVVHEFSHALAFIAGGDSYANTRDRSAMEEGNADYFSASYSKSYTDYAWEKMFNWDGHNPFFEGVSIGAKLQYPQDMKDNSNADREMWSTPLMCIYDKIGREACDSLVLEHLFYQYKTATIPEMADILLTVDSLLFDQRYHHDIRNCFSKHKILLSTDKALEFNQLFNAYNTSGFSYGTADATITSKTGRHFSYSVTDNVGKTIAQNAHANTVALSPEAFKSGIYFVELKMDGFTSFLKIIKY